MKVKKQKKKNPKIFFLTLSHSQQYDFEKYKSTSSMKKFK